MQIFKKILIALISCVIILFWLIPHFSPTIAQVCGGVTSCSSSLYHTPNDYKFCIPDSSTPWDTGCTTAQDQFSGIYYCTAYKFGENGFTPYQYNGCTNAAYTGFDNATCKDVGECGGCVTQDEFCNVTYPQWLYSAYDMQTGGGPEDVYCYTDYTIGFFPGGSAQCGNVSDLKWCTSGCSTFCNQAPYTNCNACNYPEPTNTCGTSSTSHTCQYNGPQPCSPSGSANLSCGTVNYNSCSTNFTCPAGAGNEQACVTNVTAHVYTDYGWNGIQDGTDTNTAGITLSDGSSNAATDGNGNATFGSKTTGNYTFTMTVPANFEQTTTNPYGFSINTSNGNSTINFGITPLYSIAGLVYYDKDHSKSYSAGGDAAYSSGTIAISGGPTNVANPTINADGTWTTPTTLLAGTYTVTYTLPGGATGYSYSTSNSYTVKVGDPAGGPSATVCSVGGNPNASCGGTNNGSISNLDIGVDEPYQISGTVFNDINKNLTYDRATESAYTTGSNLTITGSSYPSGQNFAASSGVYSTGQVLSPGTYTVSYNTSSTPLPTGYIFTTASSYQVTVGPTTCSKGSNPDASCGNPNSSGANSGSINNLDIGVIDENSWQQGVCLDVRNDNNGGTYSDPIPATPDCGGVTGAYSTIANASCPTGSGIPFSCNGTFDFGNGSANAANQQAGGSGSNQECFKPAGLNDIRTSYEYMMTTARESNITPTDMNDVSVCGGTGIPNCTLPTDIDGNPTLTKGIYQANGNVYLNAYTFKAPPDPSTTGYAYIFLINGDLHIQGNILVPVGSVAFFSVSGSIYVDKSVGQDVTAATVNTTSVNSPNIEGFYSADNNFVIQSGASGGLVCNSDGTPIDKKLNVVGIIVSNANQGGGSLINDRDLCIYDNECSSLTIGDGINANDQGLLLTYLLNLAADGQFATHPNFNWQEVRP